MKKVKPMNEEQYNEVKRLMDSIQRFGKADWRRETRWGIKASEVRVLLCIKDIYRQCDNANVSDISKRLSVTSPTVTQMIKSLAAHGLIERTPDPRDKRVSTIKLTARGEEITEKATNHFRTVYSGLRERLGKEQTDTLIHLLDQVYDYFEEALKNRGDS